MIEKKEKKRWINYGNVLRFSGYFKDIHGSAKPCLNWPFVGN